MIGWRRIPVGRSDAMNEQDAAAIAKQGKRSRRRSYQRAAGMALLCTGGFFGLAAALVDPSEYQAWANLGVETWLVQVVVGVVLLVLGLFF
jgi:succinate dehydrogenase hydrophobic anchor subunit